MNQPVSTTIVKSSFWQRLKQRWWLMAIGVVVVLVVIGTVFGKGGSDATYVTSQVQRGTLIQTVEASGELSSLTDVDLSFESSGTVSTLPVSIGDEVIQGQLLASLASDSTFADLSRAQEAVNYAQANINQLLAGSSDEDVAAAQAAYDAAQVEYTNAIAIHGAAVAAAFVALNDAQDDLAQVREDRDKDAVQVYADLRSVLRDSVIDIRSVLADADDVLGRENREVNDEFESILAASNTTLINTANRSYDAAAEYRDDVEVLIYILTSSSSQEEVIAASDKLADALEQAATALYDTRRVLDATYSNSTKLSKAELDTFKTTIDAARATIQSQEEALLAQRQLIETTTITNQASEEDAQNAYDGALAAYTKAQAERDAAIASAAAGVTSRSADLAKVVAVTRSVDVAPLYAQLGQAQADLSAAQAQLAKIELRSPVTGVVTDIVFDAGEFVAAGTIAMTVQNTQLDAYKVTMQISESDIAKVELDQPAEMTFDAFSDDVLVDGHVMRIDPAQVEIEGVVYYEVDVAIDEGVAGMKPGMSVDVTILTNQKDDVVFVPQRAVLKQDDESYVRIKTQDGYEVRTVQTGLRGDGGSVEILYDVVTEGEEIILSIQE